MLLLLLGVRRAPVGASKVGLSAVLGLLLVVEPCLLVMRCVIINQLALFLVLGSI